MSARATGRAAKGSADRAERSADRTLEIRGASENTLRDLDVSLSGGLTAVVGVSGSGKSSLVFDTVFHEARRRFLESLSLGSPWAQLRPARVRSIDGLGPAVAIAQNVVNRNPHSTVATAAGIHPFLRVLYATYGTRRCPRCDEDPGFVAPSLERQVAWMRDHLGADDACLDVLVPLVRHGAGSHRRLLAYLVERFGADAVEVDGIGGAGADGVHAEEPHDIDLRLTSLSRTAGVDEVRSVLRSVAGLGGSHVVLRDRTGTTHRLARVPLCPSCGERIPALRPTDFRPPGSPDRDQSASIAGTRSCRLGGWTLDGYVASTVSEARAALAGLGVPAAAGRLVDHIRVRLEALESVELGYLPLDRPSPTLSRGEAQRLRLAVIFATQVQDLLHVLDEPTIGLGADQVARLMRQLGRLRGPVVMVEHDRWAVADADEVLELGPGGGAQGGELTFRGPPAELWRADTVTGRWFSNRQTDPMPAAPSGRRAPPDTSAKGWLTIEGARANNLHGLDCAIPLGRLTVITGPSGAGKTTLARDVVVASIEAGEPRGCARTDGPPLRAVTVDQSPIGRNPRSNPATYTGLAGHVRSRFAAATGLPGSAFSFNRTDGACPDCSGMGAVELSLLHLPSEWLVCQTCDGQRFGSDVLEARVQLADGRRWSIAEVYDLSVDRAAEVLADDSRCGPILAYLRDIGLGYLTLGQPSPTLSGGEAQRVKLTKWLTRARPGDVLFLDEPTTGLHPADLSRLTLILRRLVERGCTVLVVEHHADVVAAADWVVRLGPGGGPDGGRLLGAGPPATEARPDRAPRPWARPRRRPRAAAAITVSGATANNLRDVDVRFPKNAITAVVGVSGSGKSSLVTDVLAAEAGRRLLECLSMYERQSVKEGPEAEVASVEGLGPTVAIGPDRQLSGPRRTVGAATELSFQLGVLLAYAGSGADRPLTPAHFSPGSYEAACLTCHGLGTVAEPRPERLIVKPDAPLCKGAMYSPGYFPQSYLAKPASHGYAMIQGLAARHDFDPFETPWNEMTAQARQAFLFGESGTAGMPPHKGRWVGFFPIVSGWDQGGRYVEHVRCPACDGGRLRPEYLSVRLGGASRRDLHERPLAAVADVVTAVSVPDGAPSWVATARTVALRRLSFLTRVGLGYVHLDRPSATLSAGEAQRVKLASLLGAQLTGMTVLLDEPTRGLHPREVDALGEALCDLRDTGNTVVLVDHDPEVVTRADHVVVFGPGAGHEGGRVLPTHSAAARALVPQVEPASVRLPRRGPSGWMRVVGARENNLSGADVLVPLGVLAGLCGVSGSGKSTLGIDTVARALDPPPSTTSVAHERAAPGAHDAIEGAPRRTVWSDQSRSGIQSPGQHLGVLRALRLAYADSDAAADLQLADKDLVPRCDDCHGAGILKQNMGFLPSVVSPCDTCEGTGYHLEARRLVVRDHTLPALEHRTLKEVRDLWSDVAGVARPLDAACSVGLGYLLLGQPAHSLSGGEAQRLKLARELGKKTRKHTLYILDEPTVGLHPHDVRQLRTTLDHLVDAGNSVLVVEHEPSLLAACDWLVELGPGAGPDGGRVVAAGTPEEVAAGNTATAPYLAQVLT
jgi:excinuclease ABC subunit A